MDRIFQNFAQLFSKRVCRYALDACATRSCIDITNRISYDWSKSKYSFFDWLNDWLLIEMPNRRKKFGLNWKSRCRLMIEHFFVLIILFSLFFSNIDNRFKSGKNLCTRSDFCAWTPYSDWIKQTMFEQQNPMLILISIFPLSIPWNDPMFRCYLIFYMHLNFLCKNQLLPWIHANSSECHLISW